MIQEDIRFFKQHFPNVTIQPSFKKATLESSPFGKESASLQLGSQIESRLGSIGMQSTFAREFGGSAAFGGFGGIGGFGGVDLKGGLQLIRNTQNDVLEELRQEHEQIRKISVAQSHKTSRVSDESSSVQESKSRSSTVRQDSKASLRQTKQYRESTTTHAIQKRFESELTLKSRRIDELEASEQELQKTVQQLRTDLRKREEAGVVPSTKVKELETEFAHKLEKQISFFKKQTERFIAENTQLKKDLVAKGFEAEEARRALRQAEDQIRFREEEYKRNMRSIEQTMSSKQSHYKKLLYELESHEKPAVVTTTVSTYRDYESFKRDELSRIESSARWGRSEYGDDEASFFRKLLNDEITKAKERYTELDSTLKNKLAEVKELEKALAAGRKREGDLEAQLTQREQAIRRQVEKDADARYSEKEEQLGRKLAEREEFWARRLADAQEQWTRALSEALEREKKSNFDQFQKTFEELGRHKDSELDTLRNHRDSSQRRYAEIESEHQNNLRRLSQEVEQYRAEVAKERRRAEQYSQSLQQAKRGDSEARLKSEMLQREIDQLRSYIEKQEHSSKTAIQESERVKTQQSSQLQYELTELRTKNGYLVSQLNELKAKNTQLQASISQNTRYMTELEAALKPLQPKRPNIMQQSETQNWRVREQELLDKIEYYEQQQYAAENRSSDRSTIQFYEEKIARLQGELDRTHQQYQGHQERDTRHLDEIEELKQFIVEKVEGPGHQLRHKQLEFQRELERLQIEHGHAEESIRTKYRLQIEDLTRRLREAEEERASLETVLAELRSGQTNLDETAIRLRQELSRKDEMRREERVSLESEIARLTSQVDTWKVKYQSQVPRLKRTGQEIIKTLTDKYERELAGLKVVNQRLMQEAADLLQLQNQNQQLVIANRHLQTQVKEKSLAVEHLWSVKQAEYENIALQIRRVRAVQTL